MFNMFNESRIRLLGFGAIAVFLVTWGMDFFSVVDPCPYCRTQRSVIGLLGLLMIFRSPHWTMLHLGNIFAFYGAHVAALQHFMNWDAFDDGNFEMLYQPIYKNDFYLSAAALIIILTQFVLINRHWLKKPALA
ncbi:disulfide bond formation protein B [Vibrio diabolicus]|uniref:disulfide bond formation protein B n=1 Tax=Vibrio diabolicus TaxID=50719 RepID=UPI002493F70C|nr:disulfide bond formation protein B [Vibrio diabolicus]EGR0589990.1 disulfide bond formation protein B [Vibrio cholerae]ELJ8601696.1 disulfide bond formation protein B [Vibrio cholerae]